MSSRTLWRVGLAGSPGISERLAFNEWLETAALDLGSQAYLGKANKNWASAVLYSPSW